MESRDGAIRSSSRESDRQIGSGGDGGGRGTAGVKGVCGAASTEMGGR